MDDLARTVGGRARAALATSGKGVSAGSLLLLLLCGGCFAEQPLLPDAGLPPPRNQVVFLGDSLTAGDALSPDEAYPAIIGRYWAERGISLRAINAGVSGDTTADVLLRLDRAVSERTCFVFLEIGPNDGFARIDPAAVADNLSRIVRRLEARGIRVALAGMWLPMEVDSGSDYRRRFDAIYGTVGRELRVPVLPGFLRNLVTRPSYWQSDGLHPTAAGDRILARDALAFLNPAWRLPTAP